MTGRRPIPVTILAFLYIVVGIASTAAHVVGFRAHPPSLSELVSISVLGVAAVAAGVFMLRACNWARWLALAWMAAHVALSAFHPLRELIVHSLLLILFAYLLFRPEARAYFSSRQSGAA